MTRKELEFASIKEITDDLKSKYDWKYLAELYEEVLLDILLNEYFLMDSQFIESNKDKLKENLKGYIDQYQTSRMKELFEEFVLDE